MSAIQFSGSESRITRRSRGGGDNPYPRRRPKVFKAERSVLDMPPFDDKAKTSDDNFRVQAPQLNLPKGGGAIRGIVQKFAVNPVTGTGSLTVPIFPTPALPAFRPQFLLST